MPISPNFHYENPLRHRFNDHFVKNLPPLAGVYFFLDANKTILYIGKAGNLRKRLSSYWLAKPGTVADHTLEMLELVKDLQWEIHTSGKRALQREGELIRALKPPYNIAGTEPMPYLYIGLKYPNLGLKSPFKSPDLALKSPNLGLKSPFKSPDLALKSEQTGFVDFRLSYQIKAPEQEGYRLFGCYLHRGKVKAGYSALLRLLHVSVVEKDRYSIPSRICHVSPPYLYRSPILQEWKEPLHRFLMGKSRELLRLITFRMLENEDLPRFMIPSLQRDLEITKNFFRSGPSATRKVARALGLKKAIVTPSKMNELITSTLKLTSF